MKASQAIAAGAVASLLAMGAAGAQPAAPTVIELQLSDFRYSPATIELNQGQPYVLRLSNPGRLGHDLKAKTFFQTVSLAPESAAKVQDGDVQVRGGETIDLALTPNTAGSYEMHCTHPMHSMLGMKGQIVVH